MVGKQPVLAESGPSGPIRRGFLFMLACVPSACLLAAGSPEAAFVYHLCSRIAYIAFAGVVLSRMDRRGRSIPPETGMRCYRTFRTRVAFLMNNDAISFAALLWTTRGSLEVHLPWSAIAALGAIPVAIGVGFKIWALIHLGPGSYFWLDFFVEQDGASPCRRGPYRWLAHPMYTLGNAHVWGLAWLCWSWPGLIAAVTDHLSVILFARLVEDPHVERLYGKANWSILPAESP